MWWCLECLVFGQGLSLVLIPRGPSLPGRQVREQEAEAATSPVLECPLSSQVSPWLSATQETLNCWRCRPQNPWSEQVNFCHCSTYGARKRDRWRGGDLHGPNGDRVGDGAVSS